MAPERRCGRDGARDFADRADGHAENDEIGIAHGGFRRLGDFVGEAEFGDAAAHVRA